MRLVLSWKSNRVHSPGNRNELWPNRRMPSNIRCSVAPKRGSGTKCGNWWWRSAKIEFETRCARLLPSPRKVDLVVHRTLAERWVAVVVVVVGLEQGVAHTRWWSPQSPEWSWSLAVTVVSVGWWSRSEVLLQCDRLEWVPCSISFYHRFKSLQTDLIFPPKFTE